LSPVGGSPPRREFFGRRDLNRLFRDGHHSGLMMVGELALIDRWAACGQSVRVPSGYPAVYAAKPPGISITQAARVATLAGFRCGNNSLFFGRAPPNRSYDRRWRRRWRPEAGGSRRPFSGPLDLPLLRSHPALAVADGGRQ